MGGGRRGISIIGLEWLLPTAAAGAVTAHVETASQPASQADRATS